MAAIVISSVMTYAEHAACIFWSTIVVRINCRWRCVGRGHWHLADGPELVCDPLRDPVLARNPDRYFGSSSTPGGVAGGRVQSIGLVYAISAVGRWGRKTCSSLFTHVPGS